MRHRLSEHDLLGAVGSDLSRLTQLGREAAEEQLASATASLLNLDLGDLLIYAWRIHHRLIEAANRTVQAPGREELVQLGSERITATRHPTIELLVDGVKVHTFRFELSVIFDMEVAVLIVRGGQLTGLKAGGCTVACTLTLQLPGGDLELLSQQQTINPHVIVNASQGIPLLPASR